MSTRWIFPSGAGTTLLGCAYVIRNGFLIGLLLSYDVVLEYVFEDGFFLGIIKHINMELNMNLVPLEDLELISAMVQLMESRENGNLDNLFDVISLRKEDGA